MRFAETLKICLELNTKNHLLVYLTPPNHPHHNHTHRHYHHNLTCIYDFRQSIIKEGMRKNPFLLGQSPKLWVGKGQESKTF